METSVFRAGLVYTESARNTNTLFLYQDMPKRYDYLGVRRSLRNASGGAPCPNVGSGTAKQGKGLSNKFVS